MLSRHDPDHAALEADARAMGEAEERQDFLEAVAESTLSPEQKRAWEKVCFWEAVNEYAAACAADTSDRTISDRRMNAVAALERVVENIRTAAKATGG